MPSSVALPELDSLPGLPLDDDGPVFSEPWQAQAFALVLKLHEQGLFTWAEWAEQLSRAIAAARAQGDPDLGDTYYYHWLAALESIAADKNLVSPETLAQRKDQVREEHTRLHGHDHHENHP